MNTQHASQLPLGKVAIVAGTDLLVDGGFTA